MPSVAGDGERPTVTPPGRTAVDVDNNVVVQYSGRTTSRYCKHAHSCSSTVVHYYYYYFLTLGRYVPEGV